MLATLLASDGETYLLPALDEARIRRVRGGVLISGIEILPRGRGAKNVKSDDFPQTWWCTPVREAEDPRRTILDDLSPEEDVRAVELEGERVGKILNRWPRRRSY